MSEEKYFQQLTLLFLSSHPQRSVLAFEYPINKEICKPHLENYPSVVFTKGCLSLKFGFVKRLATSNQLRTNQINYGFTNKRNNREYPNKTITHIAILLMMGPQISQETKKGVSIDEMINSTRKTFGIQFCFSVLDNELKDIFRTWLLLKQNDTLNNGIMTFAFLLFYNLLWLPLIYA